MGLLNTEVKSLRILTHRYFLGNLSLKKNGKFEDVNYWHMRAVNKDRHVSSEEAVNFTSHTHIRTHTYAYVCLSNAHVQNAGTPGERATSVAVIKYETSD